MTLVLAMRDSLEMICSDKTCTQTDKPQTCGAGRHLCACACGYGLVDLLVKAASMDCIIVHRMDVFQEDPTFGNMPDIADSLGLCISNVEGVKECRP